ncbi:hypothetical protein [Treponema putidum]|uniref:hypothetical protein n=2 Tax=Treponema putidum TaxID=221027 RepID=UPI002103A119|nr:hypothetical protein [Treponema putidum]UTY30499.1 hypothetical protein E4N75_02250 [Treponema putidum]
MKQQTIFNLLKNTFGQNNLLTVPTLLVKKLKGDHCAALFLGQLIYWTGKGSDSDGWIYKTYQEWEEELFIKKDKAMAIKKKLEALNLITTIVKKIGNTPVLHYKVNQETLIEFLLETCEKEGDDKPEDKATDIPSDNEEKPKSDEETSDDNSDNQDQREKENKGESRNFRKSEIPKVGKTRFPKWEIPTFQESGQNQLSISNINYIINYIHKLLSLSEPLSENLSEKNEREEEFLVITKKIHEVFLSCNIKPNTKFKDFLESDFITGITTLYDQKIYVSLETLLSSCENYAKVLALKREESTWWKAVLPFDRFCQNKIISKFLPENFNLEDFILEKERSKKAKDYNNSWVKNFETIPF